MTQEEKAKAYDEVINRMKHYVVDENGCSRIKVVDVFPELKESEDEKIRKEMIEILKKEAHDFPSSVIAEKSNSWIAWLEKQGEKEKFIKKELNCIRDYREEAIRRLHELEKQGEQKPVDKVEPKFKVGDWINGYYTNYKVLSVNNEGYVVEDVDGNKINILFENEKFHYLWTIQDAKDGDVLYLQKDGKEHIIIYKGVLKERFRTFVSAYCAYNGIVDAFCFADVSRYVDIAYKSIMPATKEQRDLLFQKMKEAGYEWDIEKKKLKKIEQKLAENKGMNLVEENMTPFQKKVFCIIDTAIEEEQGLKQVCDELLSLASDEIIQKPAWSEEDDRMLDKCIEVACSNYYPGISSVRDWLRGIKDRVQPQPKQEWSEEEEEMLNLIIARLHSHPNVDLEEYSKEYDWLNYRLKSLRPQTTWKPSDKQMDVLLSEVTALTKGCPKQIALESLYNDLKKLKA